MEWLLLLVFLGFIPAAIAQKKGYSFGLWWLYGFALFIVALPHALIIAPDRKSLEQRRVDEEGMRKCPHCAELVKVEAKICRYCQRDLPASTDVAPTAIEGPQVACRHCRRMVHPTVDVCPFCATLNPGIIVTDHSVPLWLKVLGASVGLVLVVRILYVFYGSP